MTHDNDNNDNNDEERMKIVFLPGSLDNFDGTQDELEDFIKEIEAMAEDGSLFEQSVSMDFDDLAKADPEAALRITLMMGLEHGLIDKYGDVVDPELADDLTAEDMARLKAMVQENNRKQ